MARSIHLIATHPVARESYTFLVDRQSDFEVSGQDRSVRDALQKMQVVLPDAVVISLPAHDEALTEAVRAVRGAHPALPIVAIIGDSRLPPGVVADAGATACLTRDQVPFDMLPLIRHMLHAEKEPLPSASLSSRTLPRTSHFLEL